MPYDNNKSSRGGSGLDWRGCNETAPPASPDYEPNDDPDRPYSRGDSWKGMDDGTPAAKPTEPDK